MCYGPRPKHYKNTLTRQDIPKVQRLSPRSWARGGPFYGICSVWTPWVCWVTPLLHMGIITSTLQKTDMCILTHNKQWIQGRFSIPWIKNICAQAFPLWLHSFIYFFPFPGLSPSSSFPPVNALFKVLPPRSLPHQQIHSNLSGSFW